MSVNAKSPSSSAGYTPGDNFVMCDICGRRFRASEVREQPHGLWKGLMVCDLDYDDYNPQHEDIRAVPERITPDKVSVEPESTTLTYATRITADDL